MLCKSDKLKTWEGEYMKRMSIENQLNTNAGSVRCDRCGMTYWSVGDCKTHIRHTHGHGSYTWRQWGPYGHYTSAWQHYGWSRYGRV